jgi:LacI family transcriptional regulator
VTTIRDVAKLAAVSVATVSNALNNPGRVSPELVARVGAAVEKLGYAPHAAARSLRKRASGLVGLIVADITNPFFTELFEAIENAAAAKGYSVLVCNSNERVEREEAHLRMLRTQRIDGLILAPTGAVSSHRARLLAALDVPVVLVDRALDGLGYDAVVLDNRQAALDAVAHVIARGHRRIGMINGPEMLRTAADRLQGYREALLAAGLPFDPALVRNAEFREKEARDAAIQLLRTERPPTAIFAANNLMMIGAMRALSELGLACPDHVSVVGIDDFPWADAFAPRLTTIAQPVRDMGERTFGLLADRITGARQGEGATTIMAPRLIVRGSCAAPTRT